MNKALFHPQMTGTDAARIASERGGRLVWRSSRVPIIKSRLHADSAMSAIESGDYEAAIGHIRAAGHQIAEVQPCHQ